MHNEGPPLERLTRRLAECPADMLAEPAIAAGRGVHVPAVVSDLLSDLGGRPLTPADAAPFTATGTSAAQHGAQPVALSRARPQGRARLSATSCAPC